MEILNKLIDTFNINLQEARGTNPHDDVCSGRFTFLNCIITFAYRKNSKEVEIWNPVKGTYHDIIAEHIKAVSPSFDDLQSEQSDEWNINGFRNEADYLRYRYG